MSYARRLATLQASVNSLVQLFQMGCRSVTRFERNEKHKVGEIRIKLLHIGYTRLLLHSGEEHAKAP
jgi:hypothetical protein